MQITLNNGTVLYPIIVTGASMYTQGASRDALTFIFDDSHSMDELDGLFSESNCESIKIMDDDGNEAIHNGYVIRVSLTKNIEVTQAATSDTEEVTENRIQVVMAQRTYSETKLASLSEEITNTQLALCEIYEGGI